MTSKSIGLSNCCCFNVRLISVLLLPGGFLAADVALWRPTTRTKCFTLLVWKSSYSFAFFFLPPLFTSPCIRRNLIFHISFWFVDVIWRDAGSHATDQPAPLISLTTTNYKWRTNERKIGGFHGNWQAGLSFLIPTYKWSLSARCWRQLEFTVRG